MPRLENLPGNSLGKTISQHLQLFFCLLNSPFPFLHAYFMASWLHGSEFLSSPSTHTAQKYLFLSLKSCSTYYLNSHQIYPMLSFVYGVGYEYLALNL